MRERYGPRMRLEAVKKGSTPATVDKLSRLSGNNNYPCSNHNRYTQVYNMNLKTVTTTKMGKLVPSCSTLLSDDSDRNKIATETNCGKNKISTKAENKENEVAVIVTSNNGKKEQSPSPDPSIITEREKNFCLRQEKQELSDNDDSNEDSGEVESQEHEELANKPVLKVNIPSTEISYVEIKLNKLEITQSETVEEVEGQLKKLTISQTQDDKGVLCERSPMRNEERLHRHNYIPYTISSNVLYNGGGIVAEAPPVPDQLHIDYSPVQYNIANSPESNNHLSLPPSPEYPFGQECSSPPSFGIVEEQSQSPSSPMPDLVIPDWLIDNNRVTEVLERIGGNKEFNWQPQITESEVKSVLPPPSSTSQPPQQNELSPNFDNIVNIPPLQNQLSPNFDSIVNIPPLQNQLSPNLDSIVNIPPQQIELSSDFDILFALPHSPPSLRYRQTETSRSISSPSSGSLSSFESSPLSSPAPSLGDSVNGTSDSDTEYELRKIELIMREGSANSADTSVHAARPTCQLLKNSNPNNFLSPGTVSNHLNYYPLTSKPTIAVQSVPRQIQLAPNVQRVVIQNNFQHVVNTLPQQQQQPHIQRGPVVPNTVAMSARERIAAKLNKKVKDLAVVTLAQIKDEQLTTGDDAGDTQLMILVSNNNTDKLECIYAMINRIKNIPGALEARNVANQSALLLACLFLPEMPLVARFIAETLIEKGIPVNEVYKKGNTLLHFMCAMGDSHLDVLVELLSMRDSRGLPCFDVNQHNHDEGTPLHTAVKTHSKKVNCSRTVAFLLSQGAKVLEKKRHDGKTALHLVIRESCDPLLVQILLQAAERKNVKLVNEVDYQRDTALHLAALRNDDAFDRQFKVIQLLMRYGAMSNLCGSLGRTPLALVSAERKSEIQKIIHRR